MAGIEQIVVHSKSYVVRWVEVSEQHTISWSCQPQKKSINFGIFRHPGTKNGLTPALPTQETLEPSTALPPTPGLDGIPRKLPRRGSVNATVVVEKLQGIGLRSVAWAGKCEADKVSMGRYDVPEGEGGMYGLVFDNTFSKQTSKTVTFVLMTHPINAAPKSGHHLHYSQAFASGSTNNVGKGYSPGLHAVTDSNESLPQTPGLTRGYLDDPRPNSKGKGVESKGAEGTSFYTGVLNKKRRRKGQGYAKRFFSLDFTSSTLSYYRNRHSSALRGAVPLSLAVIGANEKTREFSVDSGAEVWHLKALNKKEFEGWRDALERASASVSTVSATATSARTLQGIPQARVLDPAEENEWAVVEQLVSKVAGTRDAVRGLAKDTDPKYLPGANGAGLGLSTSRSSSTAASPSSYEQPSQYFPDMDEHMQERRPFWKRKPSSDKSPAALFRRSVSAQLAVPAPSSAMAPTSPVPSRTPGIQKRPSMATLPTIYDKTTIPDNDVHERCMALLHDLDNVVSDFAALIAESRARRTPRLSRASTRLSMDSIDDQEFFDAEGPPSGGPMSPSQLLSISEFDDTQDEQLFEHGSDAESDTSSDAGDTAAKSAFDRTPKTAQQSLFPVKPQSLSPLPLPPTKRRTILPPPKQSPPSIIGFLRKNAGKDLSTVTMPVTANEPTSLLQRLAESLEYSQLLDAAAAPSLRPAERLIYVSAFAISFFAYNRVKERALRKPFNPMLGETYELVREDLGFRFVAEKVSHHPVVMACQAESLNNGGWCFTQSPQPAQKFWGKSVELNTEGRVRVLLREPNEHYSWSQATCFLRNVIAGEKYVEPVQSMTIINETGGLKAVVTFKAGGLFSGRSEDVTVQLFHPACGDAPIALGLTGKWTEALKRTDSGETIWTTGALVPDASKVYGYTTFAAALNETTEIEEGKLPPTDSRLRPDQIALEHNEVDKAEGLKARLEERQRSRRKVLESHGQTWKPQFFEKVVDAETDGEEVWRLKQKDSYWDRRARNDWDGVQEVFEL
ncbi:Oxysterol-binding protein 3 [Vermiconidia calcicola]|uniref:Oxysterol-binding protein 3 n=1 Tax=Vermiconidia calcicola TaxID=1690605 RepID=A0ACC3N2I9_9PEZI|nr:Oxysterol-binding protein 3 [Vermiconidia calcicola]